ITTYLDMISVYLLLKKRKEICYLFMDIYYLFCYSGFIISIQGIRFCPFCKERQIFRKAGIFLCWLILNSGKTKAGTAYGQEDMKTSTIFPTGTWNVNCCI